MSQCNEFAEMISSHVDGVLSPEETRKLEDHLVTCSSCRATLDAFLAADAAARETVIPGEQVWTDMWDRIQSDLATRENRSILFARLWRGAAFAAAAAAILLTLYVFGPQTRTPVDATSRPGFQVLSVEVGAPEYTAVVMNAADGQFPVVWIERI